MCVRQGRSGVRRGFGIGDVGMGSQSHPADNDQLHPAYTKSPESERAAPREYERALPRGCGKQAAGRTTLSSASDMVRLSTGRPVAASSTLADTVSAAQSNSSSPKFSDRKKSRPSALRVWCLNGYVYCTNDIKTAIAFAVACE